jgi:hypothetical protein
MGERLSFNRDWFWFLPEAIYLCSPLSS